MLLVLILIGKLKYYYYGILFTFVPLLSSFRSFFKAITALSSQLLESIIYYCYFTNGTRQLAHKCAQFISILAR